MRTVKTMGVLAVTFAVAGCAPPSPRLSSADLYPLRTTLTVGASLNQTISVVRSADVNGVPVI